MDSNYFNSKKYIILLILICTLLAVLTAKVFDYIPQPPENNEYEGYYPHPAREQLLRAPSDLTNNNNSTFDETASNDDEDDDDDDDEDDNTENNINDSQHKSGHIDYMPKSAYSNNDDFGEIPAPPGTVEEQINAIDTN